MAAHLQKYCALLLILVIGMANAIGENPIDFQTVAGMFAGIGQMIQNPIETLDLPIDLIMGRWFQMYKAAVNLDVYRAQTYCPVSYFKKNRIMGEDGFSIEEAYRVQSKHGPLETFKRDLNKVGTGKYWMYTEEYFYPRQFYIIKAGPNYDNTTKLEDAKIDYFVITDGSRLSLTIYARDPAIFYQKYNKNVIEFLEKNGYGGKVFWNTPRPIYQGPDCEWPSEKEVFARRVLRNHKLNQQKNQQLANSTEMSPTAFADMLKNPQLALQKLVEMH